MEMKPKLSIYDVVYKKLEQLNQIDLTTANHELIESVTFGISALAGILADGKRMRDREKKSE